jgi:hypothetical protein
MNRLLSVVLALTAGAALAQAPAAKSPPPSTGPAPVLPASQEAGGLTWTSPKEWELQQPRPMRAATYRIPSAKGDTEAAELAVFYFGQDEGGSVDANIQRWVGQFQKPDGGALTDKDFKRKKETLAGFPVTTLDVKGTYGGGGPMMGMNASKPGYRLLGAIVEGPRGSVFFKLTGPEKTVASAEKPFRKLLESVKKK